MIALPVTTAIIGLGVAASRARRRGRARRLAGLKWSASIVALFWLPGLAFGGWYVVSEIRERIYEARHYFTLDKAREVDGIAFPAGTWVALDEDEALKEAELPAGETVRLRAAAWQGKLEFAAPAHAPNAAHGRITDGTLATPAELDGIPCRAGDRGSGNGFLVWPVDGMHPVARCRSIDHDHRARRGRAGPEIALHGRRHDTHGGPATR